MGEGEREMRRKQKCVKITTLHQKALSVHVPQFPHSQSTVLLISLPGGNKVSVSLLPGRKSPVSFSSERRMESTFMTRAGHALIKLPVWTKACAEAGGIKIRN